MSKHDQHMTLSDGREVLVDYDVESYGSDASGMYGPPEDYDPGSGPELYITAITLDGGSEKGVPVEVSQSERDDLEAEIASNPDWWMPSDDPDDYRDYDD